MHPTDGPKLRLIDGVEKEFLLSMGSLRRLKKRFGVTLIKELLDRDAEEIGVPLLYEAMVDRGNMTEDEFANLLPANLDIILRTVMSLLGYSFPDESKGAKQPADPTIASPTVQ